MQDENECEEQLEDLKRLYGEENKEEEEDKTVKKASDFIGSE